MSETIIQVNNVSMMFNLSNEKVDNLKEYIIKLVKRELMFNEFWALTDISFEIKKGEAVGLVGLNGSGKSTLLKIIAGVLKPTKGSITMYGSIAPLIELGAGFDMDLSAKENVYLNGAILGYSKKEVNSRFEQIMDFAELWDFVDVPVKNFSSGMVARLGFAIATINNPDILIVDEILSVGDFKFQKKCEKRINEVIEAGATVILVSHSIEQIKKMCNKVVWIEQGKMIAQGETKVICEQYMKAY